MKPRKLLITGLCGRLGKSVMVEALAQGWNVVGIDRVAWNGEGPLPSGVEFEEGALEDDLLMDRLMSGATHFIHTAGLHGGDLNEHPLSDYLDSNVTGVAKLVERCVGMGVRQICLSSTMEVLIGRDYCASGVAMLDEASPACPDSAYSISRVLMEMLAVELAKAHEVSISVMRYMAFGYRGDAELGARLLARYLTPRDAARAAIQAVVTEGLRGEVFNIGPKTPLVETDIVRALASPQEVSEKYFPGSAKVLERAGQKLLPEMFWPVTSIEKARLLLGWEPQYTFETWLMEHGWEAPHQK